MRAVDRGGQVIYLTVYQLTVSPLSDVLDPLFSRNVEDVVIFGLENAEVPRYARERLCLPLHDSRKDLIFVAIGGCNAR